MLLESILVIFLIATLGIGIRMHIDIQQLNLEKTNFETMIQKIDSQLSDMEKLIERFRYINGNERDAFSRLTDKANTIKQDLVFLTERSENIFEKLSSTNTAIRADALIEATLIPNRIKPEQPTEEVETLNTKKSSLIKKIKHLR